MSSALTVCGRLSRAWRRYGLRQFLGLVGYNLNLVVTGKFSQHAHLFDDSFDRRHNVETRGTEEPEYLTADNEAKAHGVRYEPVRVEHMATLMGKLSSLDASRFTFVDLGSGKGRALFIAAELPFQRIIGIEYGRELHEVAVRNIATYRNPAQRCFDVVSICADASACDFPITPTICFMNNPFDEVLLARVAENLSRLLAAAPREFFLIYLNSNHRGIVDRIKAWHKLDEGLLPPSTPFAIWKWKHT